MALKRLENRPPKSSQTALKSILGPLGELLELSWQPGGLLEASWNALGALLEAFGPQKSNWGSALGRPKGTLETGFNDLGGQKAPKTEPGRIQNGAPEATRAENCKTTKLVGPLYEIQ